MSMNEVRLVGRVSVAPTLRETQNGKKVTTLSVVTNENTLDKDGKQTTISTFTNVTFWDKVAEYVSTLGKGDLVTVFGKLSTRKETTTENGVEKNKYHSEVQGVKITCEQRSKKGEGENEAATTAQSDDLPF